ARQVDAQVAEIQARDQGCPQLAAPRQPVLEGVGELLGAAELDADARGGQPGRRRHDARLAHDISRSSQVNATAEPMTAKASTSSSSPPPMTDAQIGTRPAGIGRCSGGSWASEPAPSHTA